MDNKKKRTDYKGVFLISTIGCGISLVLFASCPPLFFIAIAIVSYLALSKKK